MVCTHAPLNASDVKVAGAFFKLPECRGKCRTFGRGKLFVCCGRRMENAAWSRLQKDAFDVGLMDNERRARHKIVSKEAGEGGDRWWLETSEEVFVG